MHAITVEVTDGQAHRQPSGNHGTVHIHDHLKLSMVHAARSLLAVGMVTVGMVIMPHPPSAAHLPACPSDANVAPCVGCPLALPGLAWTCLSKIKVEFTQGSPFSFDLCPDNFVEEEQEGEAEAGGAAAAAPPDGAATGPTQVHTTTGQQEQQGQERDQEHQDQQQHTDKPEGSPGSSTAASQPPAAAGNSGNGSGPTPPDNAAPAAAAAASQGGSNAAAAASTTEGVTAGADDANAQQEAINAGEDAGAGTTAAAGATSARPRKKKAPLAVSDCWLLFICSACIITMGPQFRHTTAIT